MRDPKKPTCVAAPSPRASLGRRTVCGRTEQRRPPVSKRYEIKVRMVWGSFLIAAAALKTPTRNGYNAQGVNLTFRSRNEPSLSLYKILFRFSALVWESFILLPPPPTCEAYSTAILLHDHCAVYAPPPTPPSIHHTILVMAISRLGLTRDHIPSLIE